jgi:hypothetical protein
MSRLVRILGCLVFLVGATAGLADAQAPTDIVVLWSSSSANVAAHLVPVVGESCAPTLRDLRKAGFKIIDVQASAGLLYTLENDGHKGAVVIVACAPLPATGGEETR